MSKKGKSSHSSRVPSKKLLVSLWVSTLFSMWLLFEAGSAVLSDVTGFRSCNSNTSCLRVAVCGKQSVNFGDIVLVVLFIASATLVVCLATAAWRQTQRFME